MVRRWHSCQGRGQPGGRWRHRVVAVEMMCGPHADRSGRWHSDRRLYLLLFPALHVAPVHRGAPCAGAGARWSGCAERRGAPGAQCGRAPPGRRAVLSGSAPVRGGVALAHRAGEPGRPRGVPLGGRRGALEPRGWHAATGRGRPGGRSPLGTQPSPRAIGRRSQEPSRSAAALRGDPPPAAAPPASRLPCLSPAFFPAR